MHYYFYIQKLRVERILTAFGLHPYVALLLLPVGFVFIGSLLYYKTEWASAILVSLCFYSLLPLSDRKRNQFIKSTFSKNEGRQIRVIENTIITTPFCGTIAYFDSSMILGFITFLLGVIMALSNTLRIPSFVTPTPFYKHPHEHIRGFRKTWVLYLPLLLLAYISFTVLNYYLSMFCIFLIIILSLTYYDEVEHHFFIWNENKNAQAFLFQKLQIGLMYSSVLILPILIPIMVFYPDQIVLSLALAAIGYGFILLGIVAKYCRYPSHYQLKEILLIGISIAIPPLLFVSIPYFYKNSLHSLDVYLHDKD